MRGDMGEEQPRMQWRYDAGPAADTGQQPAAPTDGRWRDDDARRLLRRMFQAAVTAADPVRVLARHLPERPSGRCVVVGAGKAAGSMAVAVESAWADVDLCGAVVAPYGYGRPTSRIAMREAAHPVPDDNSQAAAREMLGLVSGLGPDDLVLALISGGGSSVLSLPITGISLEQKRVVNRALLASGLDIRTMNAVRRRLSAIKGGKLAAAAGQARVVTLAISDIPGDDVAAIASGPTIPDPEWSRDLSPVADRLRGILPEEVLTRLRAPPDAPPRMAPPDARIVATPASCLRAAAEVANDADVDIRLLGDDLEGESSELGRAAARLAGEPTARPTVWLSGGETTVTLAGGPVGRGGRNTEFALALANALQERDGVWALAADTDGEDGASGGGAGAIVAPDTLVRARVAGFDPARSLVEHDSGSLFAGIGDLVVTGPTYTNVNDFRAVLVVPK